jgi:hypothetical protein
MYSATSNYCQYFIQVIYRWIMYDIQDDDEFKNAIEMQIIIRPPSPPVPPPHLLTPPPSPPLIAIRQRITAIVQQPIEEPCDFEIIEIGDIETKKE